MAKVMGKVMGWALSLLGDELDAFSSSQVGETLGLELEELQHE
jgi:hypothetical protein